MACSALAAADRSRSERDAWRSLKSPDFAHALAAPVMGKSTHFVLYHLATGPVSSSWTARGPLGAKLSTSAAPNRSSIVDNDKTQAHWWLGLVVPKRHARRSATRSLLKRQMRAQADRQRCRLPPGQWVIRLRAPFDPGRYPSAASSRLRDAARQELELVFASVVMA